MERGKPLNKINIARELRFSPSISVVSTFPYQLYTYKYIIGTVSRVSSSFDINLFPFSETRWMYSWNTLQSLCEVRKRGIGCDEWCARCAYANARMREMQSSRIRLNSERSIVKYVSFYTNSERRQTAILEKYLSVELDANGREKGKERNQRIHEICDACVSLALSLLQATLLAFTRKSSQYKGSLGIARWRESNERYIHI